MRFFRPVIALSFAMAAVCAPAGAQVETTPIPAAVKPNFAPFAFLAGAWRCSIKSSRRPMAYVTTSAYSRDASGYWLDETTTVKPPAWEPSPLRTYDKITYDSDTQRWVDVSFGDQGAYGLTTSSGWNGNQIVWRDRAFVAGASMRSTTDTTMVKVTPSKYTTSMSFVETGSGRSVTVDGICTKR
ncbi:MAG TPA: hypothetical protein VGF18_03590 [Candidatus Tumulicola sp.]|jgi:hypothetical protein